MSPNPELLKALGLCEPCDDEEIASSLVALLTSAAHDTVPAKDFAELHKLMKCGGGSSYVDPLNMLPILLSCSDPAAAEIISLIGECGSAKEVIIAVQEASERLRRSFELDSDDGANQRDHPVDDFESQKRQLYLIVDLYSAAIPRLKLRRKSTSDTVKPMTKDIQALIATFSAFMKSNDARRLVSQSVELIRLTQTWALSLNTEAEDIEQTRLLLRTFLDLLTRSLVPNIQSSIAQRTFEECFPRLIVRSSLGDGWKEADEVVAKLLDAYDFLQVDLQDTKNPASACHLISVAYRPPTDITPAALLAFLLPVLISSMQTNTLLDESLSVLICSLNTWKLSSPAAAPLPIEVTVPLMGVIPAISSVHPNPQTRHQTFRVLSLLLSASDSKLRFQHLAELAGQSEFPQMRVAAVGLVKESLLQALSAATTTGQMADPLLGPIFLRTFGPILFRTDPPNLLDGDTLELDAFQQSPEPARLVECLALYYILIRRDDRNLTSVRDKDVFKTVDNNLLTPLRRHLNRWMDDPSSSDGHLHISPLIGLKIGLERIDSLRELVQQ